MLDRLRHLCLVPEDHGIARHNRRHRPSDVIAVHLSGSRLEDIELRREVCIVDDGIGHRLRRGVRHTDRVGDDIIPLDFGTIRLLLDCKIDLCDRRLRTRLIATEDDRSDIDPMAVSARRLTSTTPSSSAASTTPANAATGDLCSRTRRRR